MANSIMVQDWMLSIFLLLLKIKMSVKAHGRGMVLNLYLGQSLVTPYHVMTRPESPSTYPCLFQNKWEDCLLSPHYTNAEGFYDKYYQLHTTIPPNNVPGLYTAMNSLAHNTQTFKQTPYNIRVPGMLNLLPLQSSWPMNTRTTQHALPTSINTYAEAKTGINNPNNYLNKPTRRTFNLRLNDGGKPNNYLHGTIGNTNKVIVNNRDQKSTSKVEKEDFIQPPNITGTTSPCDKSITEQFLDQVDRFERLFYVTTFKKLTSISPEDRRENGISFVQSGLFLQMALLALSTEVDEPTRIEIEQSIKFHHSEQENIKVIRQIMSLLPNSTDDLKFRRATRLVLWPGHPVSKRFCAGVASALRLRIDTFNGTESPENITTKLNQMVENDSGGAIRDTFDEDDVSGGVEAVLISTMYLRGRWRSAPTLLNGTHPFHDVNYDPARTVRMIRINDVMRYADLTDWDAEAMEIFYSAPGLSLVLVVPRGRSLRKLSSHLADSDSIATLTGRMRTLRAAVTLPLYTLRMTLLLPNKLRDMGIQRLLDLKDETRNGTLRLSHAVQRLMFWAEAGRNAFKDDGIEWDEAPEMSVVVNRPYIFFVRWRNMTLMNGHFVL